MSIKIDLPEDIQLKIKIDKDIEKIIRKRIERDISEKIKEDIFLSMLFDKALGSSKLEKDDVDKVDRKIKKGIVEGLEWK